MPRLRPALPHVLTLALLALALGACSTTSPFGPRHEEAPPQPAVLPTLPPAFPPQDLVGRWGLAAYHKDEDRPRIEAAAAQQCAQSLSSSAGPDRRRDDASRRPGDAHRAAPEGRARRQDLCRPGRRSARQRAGPRGGSLRRPHLDFALDGSRSAGPLRHHGLRALRARGRQASAAEGQAEGQACGQACRGQARRSQAPGAAEAEGRLAPPKLMRARDFVHGPWRAVPVLRRHADHLLGLDLLSAGADRAADRRRARLVDRLRHGRLLGRAAGRRACLAVRSGARSTVSAAMW